MTIINNCRNCLQVTTLAEICNGEGDEILLEVLLGEMNEDGTPQLCNITLSRLQWPLQQHPHQKAWKQGKQLFKHITRLHTSNKLKKNLGNWKYHYDQQWTWTYPQIDDETIAKENATSQHIQTYVFIHQTRATNHQKIYTQIETEGQRLTNLHLPATPTIQN